MLRPDADVLTVALDSGFQSASSFARAFEDHFGMTATQWRAGGAAAWSKDRRAVRKPGQADRKDCNAPADGLAHSPSGEALDASPPTENLMNATVKTLPSYRLAYMRYTGPYGANSGIPQLWMRLQRWAIPRDLWTADRLCMGIAYDHPAVTDPAKCRYDAGIVVPPGLELDAQVNVLDFSGGKFCVAPFEGTARDIADSWGRVFSEWMPRSGYQPTDGPCVELYRGDAFDETTGVVRCDLGTPVKPL